MKLLTLHPDYFLREGFGTLMGHYAAMYSLYKDTNIVPTTLSIDFNSKNLLSAMEFFNKFDETIIYPNQAFTGIKNIFTTLDEQQMRGLDWEIMDLRNLSYEQIVLRIKNTDKNIICYWTLGSNLYYHYIKDIINNLFTFNSALINKCKNLLPTTHKNITGICVRNEYKKLSSPHIRLSIDFYKSAMEQFDTNNTKYLIFSDYIDECKIIFKDLEKQYDIEYTNSMPSAIGLCTMSLCDHNICANSSFSYWASILNKNPNKKIVCSTKFVQEKNILAKILNYKWYPEEWLALDLI